MTGAEHYAEAERVLRKLETTTGLTNPQRAELRALARLHVDLAQTAALIEVAAQGRRPLLAAGWMDAVGADDVPF